MLEGTNQTQDHHMPRYRATLPFAWLPMYTCMQTGFQQVLCKATPAENHLSTYTPMRVLRVSSIRAHGTDAFMQLPFYALDTH